MEICETICSDKVNLSKVLRERFFLFFLVFAAFSLPAYANNPPQPDGLFSVLLIFPVAILGARLAGVVRQPKKLSVRIFAGLAIGTVVVFLAAGTILGFFATVVVLFYAIARAAQIIGQGQGAKRFLIGSAVVVFALFALVDYSVSIVGGHKSSALYEYAAEMRVRRLGEAEQQFVASGPHNPETMKDLEAAKLIRNAPIAGQTLEGYRFGEILGDDSKHFLFYAVPAPDRKPEGAGPEVVPGTSLIKALLHREDQGTGRMSFAVDETGKMRRAIRGSSLSVTPEEVTHWEPVS